MKAAAAGRTELPAISPPPPQHITEGLQAWLKENTLRKPPANQKVIERQFADNAVFGICPELADSLPSLAKMCLEEKGLQYKKSWDVWSQRSTQFSNPCFCVREPHEGLVVLGGLVHDTDSFIEAEVIIGKDSYLEKHVESFLTRTSVAVAHVVAQCSRIMLYS